MNLKELHPKHGQSLWLDYIRRHLLESGEFARLVREDGIRGVTSNPSIFEKAIAGSTDYGPALERYEKRKDETASAIYEHLAIEDIQQAADILRPVYDEADRRNGYVSMEVSPYLAHDTQATIDEATRLWAKVRRDNLMIKVPATPEGLPAIRQLIGQGVNVNITLLFSRTVCRQVAEANAHDQKLQAIRRAIRDSRHVATCVGFGPRFLHSTGQAYKGGPPSGVFLQLTCDDAQDLQVPGHRFTFSIVKAAQARGDFQVLAQRKRRVLRVHLGADPDVALSTLLRAISGAW